MSKKTFSVNSEGIVNYLRNSNSNVALKCSSSGQGSGASDDFITYSKVSCWSTNVPNSWFAVDLGLGRKVAATHYSIRYASPGNACCFRDWIFQGSNVAPSAFNPKDTNWITLAIHKNDNSVNSAYGSKIWAVPLPKGMDPYFRYFRVVQTGKNTFQKPKNETRDDWSNVFVVGGFEVWGELLDEIPDPKNVAFSSVDGFFPLNNATKQGVIYNLKDKVSIKVTASGIGKGKPSDFIATENVFCWTKNEKNSWFCVDFGDSVLVTPTHYMLKYASSANYCCPRNWLLQGSNNPDFNKYGNDPDDPQWSTLSRHSNDTSLNSDFGSHIWSVSCNQAFRYFRIIQVGKNNYSGTDAWGEVLVAGGFEIFGYSNKRLLSLPSKSCSYSHDLDGNGVVAYLQTFGARPMVVCSSIGRGQAPDFVSRQQVNCWTKNEKFSWICVDMGENVRVVPTYYTLGYSSGGSACCIRYWVFQASNSFSAHSDPSKDENWINLSIHNNDTSIGGAHATKTWALPQLTQGFRFFRVLQTGKNAYASAQKTGPDDWSDCLVAGKFELYGYISTVSQQSSSVQFGQAVQNSSNPYANNPFVSTSVPSTVASSNPIPPPYNPSYVVSNVIPQQQPLLVQPQVNQIQPPLPQQSVSNVLPQQPQAVQPQPSQGTVTPSAPEVSNVTDAMNSLSVTAECSVCMTNPKNALLVPCGHLTMCFDCSTKVMNTSRTCPICRMSIDRIIKAFIA